MDLTTLAQKTLSQPEPMLRRDWPDMLTAPNASVGGFFGFRAHNHFWESIKAIREYTDRGSGNFSEEYSGSTGWEYEQMMAFVDGQFFYSAPSTSKDYTSVNHSHPLRIETKQEPVSGVITDQVYLNDRQVGYLRFATEQERSDRNDRIRQGEFTMGFFAHFHSHPKIQVSGLPKQIYTFYSSTDLQTFAAGTYPALGLVTDQLWILGRTKEFMDLVKNNRIHELGQDLNRITRAEIAGNDQMVQTAAKLMSRYEVALYLGRFGGGLDRIC